jgi:DinB superfamily
MAETTNGAAPTNPHLRASLAVLEELYNDLIAFLRPLDEARLKWTPPAPETNSIAALVRHIVGSNNAWLARAADEPFQRERDAEFRANDSADALVTTVEWSQAEARRRFALLDKVDPSTIRIVRRLHATEDAELSVEWCVAHALTPASIGVRSSLMTNLRASEFNTKAP